MDMDTDTGSMHSSFFWGKDVIVLFSGWPNHSLPMYILACLFVFFMAAAAEFLSIAQSVKSEAKSPVVGAAVQACFYAVKMALSYMVMLAVMSFNLGVFISAVLGHSLGLFVVKRNSVTLYERFHANGRNGSG
ncbi:Copper transporter 6 [Linum grandiflorum]